MVSILVKLELLKHLETHLHRKVMIIKNRIVYFECILLFFPLKLDLDLNHQLGYKVNMNLIYVERQFE